MPQTQIQLPDIGDFDKVEIIEVLISPGDRVESEAPLLTLESEKASMEVPSPVSGTITQVLVKVGDKISRGDDIAVCDADEASAAADNSGAGAAAAPTTTAPADDGGATARAPSKPAPRPARAPQSPPVSGKAPTVTPDSVYASPSVRKLARSLGADLTQIPPTGSYGRILGEDVQAFVRTQLSQGGGGSALFEGIEPLEEIDYSKFGPVSTEKLSRINELTALGLSRSWLSAPHVTQFDEADIGALEKERKRLNEKHKDDGVKFTFLSFLVKAVTIALKEMPRFNSSLNPDKKSLTIKGYYHIGIAVDTPAGLVVPVLHDADRKSVKEIAAELAAISQRARDRKLSPKDLQGGSFTISSLGGIGGTAFTPIINLPEVAILGVSRAQMRPHWDGKKFVAVNKLPLGLSYDHRVIDGAAAARFTTALGAILADPGAMLD